MRSLSIVALVLALLGTGDFALSFHEASAAPPPPADFAQPQSAARPEPFPVKMVDQGKFDPALKGYYLPEGFKLEVVINEPDTINPVGMTFGPDGTLYVMEWRPDPVTGDKLVRGEGDVPLPGRDDAPGRDHEEVHHRPGEAVQLQRRRPGSSRRRRSSSPRNCRHRSCITRAGCM